MLKKIGDALDIPYVEILIECLNGEEKFTSEEKRMVLAWRNMNTGVKNAIYLLMNQFDPNFRKAGCVK